MGGISEIGFVMGIGKVITGIITLCDDAWGNWFFSITVGDIFNLLGGMPLIYANDGSTKDVHIYRLTAIHVIIGTLVISRGT